MTAYCMMDSLQAICRPFASIRENVYNRPTLYALLAWSGALFFSSPQLFFFEKRNDDCVPAYSEWWQVGSIRFELSTTIFQYIFQSFSSDLLQLNSSEIRRYQTSPSA